MINLLIKFAIKFANMIIIAYLCSRNRMKKRDIMATNKGKRKAGHILTQHSSTVSVAKRSETVREFSSVTVHVCVVRHPVLQGIGSLGNISGGYVRFGRYMRGNYIHDMRGDWERVGRCLSESMKNIR